MIQILSNFIILIDGSSYLYRAYNALPPLTNSKGKPTGAIYGTLSMLRNIIIKYHPTYIAVVFDTKGKTFRNSLFKYYKFHRPLMPNNLQVQIKPIYDIIRAMGLPLITISNVEADDIIGTIANKASEEGYSVLISTSDKDMTQLVTSNVSLINTMNNTTLGLKEVVAKYGVPPKLIIDFLALMGDPSDNIPGVPGIGEKTTKILLQNIGGIDILYSELKKISNLTFRGAKSIARKLFLNRNRAYLSYKLATIKTDVKFDLNFNLLKIRKPIIEDLLELFEEYEFKRWITDVKMGKWLL